jgi:hypothetical protein
MPKAVWIVFANLALTSAVAAQLPSWLQGEWTRDWIQRGSAQSDTLDIHYLQTPGFFADIRIARGRSGLTGAKSFADLTDAQLKLLAGQNGLEGITTLASDVATWGDEVAFQPSDGSPDSGRLQRIPPDQMREIGVCAAGIVQRHNGTLTSVACSPDLLAPRRRQDSPQSMRPLL